MVADAYFDQRSRLGAVLFSLGGLSDTLGLLPSRTPLIQSLVEGLRDPFVFVVAGEVNTGKSTLLNALFGEEFCVSSVLPETRQIHFFRYGETPKRQLVSPALEEIELPHSFLRDFQVVDTPGVNSIEHGQELITSAFIPRADAVIYCFPATNPWSAVAWDFLECIQQDWLKKVVLVLQQSDLRTVDELTAIAEHMRNIARQRFGISLPVYPVSARLALLARTSGLDKERLLASSAFPALESCLSSLVTEAPPRQAKLVSACATGQGIMAEVQAKLATAAAQRKGLTDLCNKATELLAENRQGAHEAAAGMARQLQSTWSRMTASTLPDSLAARRRFPSLLWARDSTAQTVESSLLPPLMLAIRAAAELFDDMLGGMLATLWKEPGASLHYAVEGARPRPPEPNWPEHRLHFIATLENTACAALTESGLASFWIGRLRRRRRMLLNLTLAGAALLTGLITASATAGLSLALPGWSACALILGAGVAGRVILQRERAETMSMTAPFLTRAGTELEQESLTLAQNHASRRLDDFLPVLAPLEAVICQKIAAAVPLETTAAQLAASLSQLARSFRG